MLLAKEKGGTVVAGYEWKTDDAQVEVPYDFAMELLAIKGGGFYVPDAPASAGTAKAAAAKAAAAK